MSIEMVRSTLLWCTVINYALTEQFDTLNFAGMMLYKLGIMQLNLAPLVALYLAG